MDVKKFWQAVSEQKADTIRTFFDPSACVNWHCTNEHFTVEEFIRANCEYPGKWSGEVERIEVIGDLIVTATRICSECDRSSFHAVSFIRVEKDQIVAMDEYWGDDGDAPVWRKALKIGTPIKEERQ